MDLNCIDTGIDSIPHFDPDKVTTLSLVRGCLTEAPFNSARPFQG